MLAMVVLFAIPTPLTLEPTARLAVLATVTVVLPAVVYVRDGQAAELVARMRDWPVFAQACDRLLAPEGAAAGALNGTIIALDLLPFSTGEVINVDGGFHLRRL